ncbi:MAG TPA: nucleoside deaminase [Chthoniobacterales bacterium]
MNLPNEKWMDEAISLGRAGMNSNLGGPFGAIILCEGKIVGRGCNRVVTTRDPTAHAEIVAIREACHSLDKFDLRGCELYASCEPVRCVWRRFIGHGSRKFFTPAPATTRPRSGSTIILFTSSFRSTLRPDPCRWSKWRAKIPQNFFANGSPNPIA